MEEAQAIMLKVHMEGSGICGTYTYEIAETKVSQVMQKAKNRRTPTTLFNGRIMMSQKLEVLINNAIKKGQ